MSHGIETGMDDLVIHGEQKHIAKMPFYQSLEISTALAVYMAFYTGL